MSGKQRFNVSRIAVFGVFAILHLAPQAHADTFTISITNNDSFFVSTAATFGGLNHQRELGGNMNGKLNGESLVGAYCIGLLDPLYTNRTYSTTQVTTDAMVYGSLIPNAGAISWLMGNFAPTATTTDQQNALQAAIWRVENGTAFELDGADNSKTGNSSTLIATYRSYLSQLGNKVAPVADMVWISPNDSKTSLIKYQGVVGLRASSPALTRAAIPSPEPATLPLLGSTCGVLGIVLMKSRRHGQPCHERAKV